MLLTIGACRVELVRIIFYVESLQVQCGVNYFHLLLGKERLKSV